MQIQRKMTDKLSFTAEANTQKELFEKLSEIDKWTEVFGVESCGVCKNRNIKFTIRVVTVKEGPKKGKVFKYPELVCNNLKCRAKLCIGEHQVGGTLYPKLKNKEKEYLPNNGWAKYTKESEELLDNEHEEE